MRVWRSRNRAQQDEVVSLPPLPAADLPTPVGAQSSKKKSARIGESALKVRWSAFKKRLGTGSALSESLQENEELEGAEPSNSTTATSTTQKRKEKTEVGPEEQIDEIVVDNLLASDETHKSVTDLGGTGTGGSPEKSGAHGSRPAGTSTDHAESLSGAQGESSWLHLIWTVLRWRLYPNIYRFFFLQFYDGKVENQFHRETWFTSKRLALSTSLFYVINWLIGVILQPKPFPMIEKIFYWGISPAFTLPLPFLVIYDLPRHKNSFYQIFLACSTWMWSFYQLLFLILCGFYGQKRYFVCANRDFISMLYYASALPAIALFGLGQQRLPSIIFAVALFITMSIGILPYKPALSRSVLNFFIFQIFLLWLHYLRENVDRRLYSLRDQMKIQFRATQKAQVNERRTADSKRRLTSYIFHEVRVPLNTALLAVQNIHAHGSVHKDQDIEFAALEGSLSMMSKVLNDVLDFNRMDSGRFESVARPYSFHTVIRSMFVPLQLAANARGLELQTHIDKRIDEVARRALYQAQEQKPEWIEERLQQDQEEGIVVGDEIRLRQIITNLSSNACKFTQTGGKISVRTRLIGPVFSENSFTSDSTSLRALSTTPLDARGLSSHRLGQHDLNTTTHLETIVVRIEVEDTGVGIRSRDLVDNKLFSPYVQTEIGRTQGGKGTGLGLALVKHIVKLSGGRLGVRSQLGVGSTFWVELRLGVGRRVLARHEGTPSGSDRASKSLQHGPDGDKNEFAFDNPALFDPPDAEEDAPGGELVPSLLLSDSPFLGETYASFPPPVATTSALKTIMEQGGLVELRPGRPGFGSLDGQMPTSVTRTSSDISAPSESPMSTSTAIPIPQPSRNRPTYVAMPKREPMFAPSPSPSSTLPSSPGVHSGLGTGSPSTEISIRLDQTLSALVVDDDYVTRNLMSRMLGRLGVNVMSAENGAVALDMILSTERDDGTSRPEQLQSSTENTGMSTVNSQYDHRFDIIFLDNQMPVMSGLDVVRRLREMERNDFVVGVTGNALLSDQEEYLEAGVNRVLTKPVHERSVKSALNAAEQLKKRRSYEQHIL